MSQKPRSAGRSPGGDELVFLALGGLGEIGMNAYLSGAPFNWVPGIFWFLGKCVFMFFLISMAKAIVPRYRYDQLMRLGWKVFLPLSLLMVVVVAGILQYTRVS